MCGKWCASGRQMLQIERTQWFLLNVVIHNCVRLQKPQEVEGGDRARLPCRSIELQPTVIVIVMIVNTR